MPTCDRASHERGSNFLLLSPSERADLNERFPASSATLPTTCLRELPDVKAISKEASPSEDPSPSSSSADTTSTFADRCNASWGSGWVDDAQAGGWSGQGKAEQAEAPSKDNAAMSAQPTPCASPISAHSAQTAHPRSPQDGGAMQFGGGLPLVGDCLPMKPFRSLGTVIVEPRRDGAGGLPWMQLRSSLSSDDRASLPLATPLAAASSSAFASAAHLLGMGCPLEVVRADAEGFQENGPLVNNSLDLPLELHPMKAARASSITKSAPLLQSAATVRSPPDAAVTRSALSTPERRMGRMQQPFEGPASARTGLRTPSSDSLQDTQSKPSSLAMPTAPSSGGSSGAVSTQGSMRLCEYFPHPTAAHEGLTDQSSVLCQTGAPAPTSDISLAYALAAPDVHCAVGGAAVLRRLDQGQADMAAVQGNTTPQPRRAWPHVSRRPALCAAVVAIAAAAGATGALQWVKTSGGHALVCLVGGASLLVWLTRNHSQYGAATSRQVSRYLCAQGQ